MSSMEARCPPRKSQARHSGPKRCAAVQRGPIAKIVWNETGLKKFLLNLLRRNNGVRQRFSVAMDVIAFRRLIHLTTDQNGVFQWGVENK